MTSHQDNNDPRVSMAYREFAREQTPASLDDRILAMARSETRTRYGVMRTWMRPAAWAATIGLSLAFLLEMNQVEMEEATMPAVEIPLPAAPEDADRVEADGSALTKSLPPAATEESARADTALMRAKDQAEPRHSIAERSSAARELASDDLSVLDEAETRARMQAGDTPAAAANVGVSASKKELATHCADAVRTTALAWFTCIEELRTAGRDADAEQELAALQARFPDFEAPVTE